LLPLQLFDFHYPFITWYATAGSLNSVGGVATEISELCLS